MITAYDIQQKTGLLNVTLEVSDNVATITSTDSLPDGIQEQIQKWYDAGTVDIKVISVRNAQLRQWLIDQNLDEVVEGKLASADTWPDIKTWKKAKVRYEYEPNVNRTDALVIALGQDLGFTDEQLDAAFNEISLIP